MKEKLCPDKRLGERSRGWVEFAKADRSRFLEALDVALVRFGKV
jgi:hypothetical protein